MQAGGRGFESRHVHRCYSLPLLELCCIFDYGLPDISRSIRSNNRLGKPDDDENQMKEKDEDIVHPGMVSKPEKTPNFGPIQQFAMDRFA